MDNRKLLIEEYELHGILGYRVLISVEKYILNKSARKLNSQLAQVILKRQKNNEVAEQIVSSAKEYFLQMFRTEDKRYGIPLQGDELQSSSLNSELISREEFELKAASLDASLQELRAELQGHQSFLNV